MKEVAAPPGRLAVYSAARASQVTGPSRTLRHGLFTQYLLTGLGGTADRDGDGQVTLHELDQYVGRHVSVEAREANREQTPVLTIPARTRAGDFVVVEGLVQ